MRLILSGYHAYNEPFPWAVRFILRLVLPPVMAAVAFLDRREGPMAVLKRALAIAAVSAVISLVVQHKWWPYHAIPVSAATAVFFACVAGEWLQRWHVSW